MKCVVAVLAMICAVSTSAAEVEEGVQQQLLDEVRRLSQQLTQMQSELAYVKASQVQSQAENAAMQTQIANLQDAPEVNTPLVVTEHLDQAENTTALVDLSEHQQTQLNSPADAHVLSNPWWQNIEIWGFGAAGYYDTGSGGTRDPGSFEIKEASLFVEAQVWEKTSFFIELQTNRLGADNDKYVRTGEVYIHLRDVLETNTGSVGVKIGRFDIPFGEEYLWQDAIDNPLITNSASYPYGWDEGVLAYGNWGELNWVAAISDGSDARSSDDTSDKAFNLKLYGNLLHPLYLSASYMYNGDGKKSAVEFGGSHFQPVTDSAVGSSTSAEVNSDMWELNLKYQFSLGDMPGYVALTGGWANQDDADSNFDRDFSWFSVEPFLQVTNRFYGVVRYSEIGTFDDDEGFHFDGKTFAGGNSAYGFDTKRFRRLGVGIGWQPNPRTRAKLEIGRDWFDLIDASNINKDDDRNFVGLEMAVGF